jgi:NAD(P)-dependent dehydrogenase (short-subunit alcohol dehydrogenase family)
MRATMGRLDGKVAVITGAAGGIGREAAILFSAEGAQVCVADVAEEAGETTASECRDAFFHKVDVTDAESVAGMYATTAERYGGIDVLYNNAGIMPADDSSVLETELDAWDRVHAVNTTGVFLCCKHGIPHLLERGGGSVINVASFVALMGAATSQIAYTASKGAVLSLSRELAVEFGRRGIRVNAPLRRDARRARATARPSADGPARPGEGDRPWRAVPRERGCVLRQRLDVPRRRRSHGRLCHRRVRN